MGGILRAFGAESREVDDVAGGDLGALDDAREDGEGGFGLVVGHQVAGVVDAREAEVAELADGAADVAGVDYDVRVAGRREGLGVWA